MNNKQIQAEEAYDMQKIRKGILRNLSKVANQPLPKKKADVIEYALGQAIMHSRNADEAFSIKMSELSKDESRELIKKIGYV